MVLPAILRWRKPRKNKAKDIYKIGLPDWFTKNTQIYGTTKYLTLNRLILSLINNILSVKLVIRQM